MKYLLYLINQILNLLMPVILSICEILSFIYKNNSIYSYNAEADENDNFSTALFRIWCPKNVDKYEGVIYLAPGFHQSSLSMIFDIRWRIFARKNKLVLLTSYMRNRFDKEETIPYWRAECGTGKALLEGLKYFSHISNHTELENCKIAMWGFSAGGQFNYHFACWKPERVITFIVIKGGYYLSEPLDETLKIPALWFYGKLDLNRRIEGIKNRFEKHRKEGALWCLAPEDFSAHSIGNTNYMSFLWMNEIIKQSFTGNKASAWIGDIDNKKIIPAAQSEICNEKKSWLPNEITARRWQKFIS